MLLEVRHRTGWTTSSPLAGGGSGGGRAVPLTREWTNIPFLYNLYTLVQVRVGFNLVGKLFYCAVSGWLVALHTKHPTSSIAARQRGSP